MSAQNPYEKYRREAILNASKEELTLMLFDGALKFCNQAITAVEGKNIMQAHRMIMRIEDIIEEFQITLNRKYEISKDFDRLFEYIYRRLVQANMKKDVTILEEIRTILKGLRDVWKEAMVLAKKA